MALRAMPGAQKKGPADLSVDRPFEKPD